MELYFKILEKNDDGEYPELTDVIGDVYFASKCVDINDVFRLLPEGKICKLIVIKRAPVIGEILKEIKVDDFGGVQNYFTLYNYLYDVKTIDKYTIDDLINNGADINSHRCALLKYLLSIKNFALSNYIIEEKNADISFFKQSICNAISAKDIQMLRWLLNHKVDLNTDNYRIMELGCFSKNLDIIRMLAAKGAELGPNKERILKLYRKNYGSFSGIYDLIKDSVKGD